MPVKNGLVLDDRTGFHLICSLRHERFAGFGKSSIRKKYYICTP